MKRCFLIFGLIIKTSYCIAKRYDGKRLYDFGLPNAQELSESLSIAIPCLVIGFIICWGTIWGKSRKENGQEEKISYIGCGGCLIMVIGGLFLVPLFSYVELAGMTLFYIFLIVAIVLGIWGWLKDKL